MPERDGFEDLLSGNYRDYRTDLPPREPVRPLEPIDPVQWAESAAATEDLMWELFPEAYTP